MWSESLSGYQHGCDNIYPPKRSEAFSLQPFFDRDRLPDIKACKAASYPVVVSTFTQACHGTMDGFHEKILALHEYYESPAFLKMIQGFSEYENYVEQTYQEIKQSRGITRKLKWGKHTKIFCDLQSEIDEKKRFVQRQIFQEFQQTVQEEAACYLERDSEYFDVAIQEGAFFEDDVDDHQAYYYIQRTQALKDVHEEGQRYTTQAYTLRENVRDCLLDHGVSSSDIQKLSRCYGHQAQQQAYQECLAIIDEYSKTQVVDACKELGTLTLDFSLLGSQAARSGNLVMAYTLADFCWSALDCIKAAGEGVLEGAHNTAQTCLHPLDAAKNVCHSIGVAAYYLGKALHTVGDLGVTYCCDVDAGQEKWSCYVDKIELVSEAVGAQLAELEVRDVVKGVASFATETVLTGKCLKAVGVFFKAARARALVFAEKALEAQPVATTVEGIPVKIAGKAADRITLMQKAGKVAPSSQQVAKSINGTRDFLEHCDFGRCIKDLCQRTNYTYKGGRIYKMNRKFGQHLRQGDYFYLDTMHKDHLEIFASNKICRKVLNLDGTVNTAKSIAAEGRRIRLS